MIYPLRFLWKLNGSATPVQHPQKTSQHLCKKFTAGFLGCQLLSVVMLAQPLPAIAQSAAISNSPGAQRLLQMFSPEIQQTLNACSEQGRVNLAAGASAAGALICGDGSSDDEVMLTDYVNTVSDVLAASSLVGFQKVLQTNPGITPQLIVNFLSNPEGRTTLERGLQSAIAQSELLGSPESATILTDEVIVRLLQTLREPDRFDNLLGSDQQYSQVVDSFCTAPGMSVAEAQAQTPELNSVQLYAICVQESGLADEILQLTN